MGEVNVGSDLTVVPGVRYQEEQTSIQAFHVKLNGSNQNGLSGEAPRLAESYRLTPGWYPSMSVKYKVNENISVLGGVFKSISLPSFGEVTPELIYAIQGNAITTGNPMLVPSTAWNFDLGANYSSNDVGLVSVNLFYKEISDLIYSMQNYMPFFPYPVVGAPADIWTRLPGPSSNYYDAAWAQQNIASNLTTGIPMNNPSKAYLRGIEISWQTHLYYLPGVLSGVVLDLNAAYMSSRQYYPSFQPVQVGGAGLHKIYNLFYETVGGSLQNQPRATYNAILGWDYMGFSSRFSLRYQQQTLISMDTQFGLQDAFYDNVTMLDISLKQQLFIENLAIFFNASNVNAHVDNYYYSHPAINAIPAGNLPTSQQTYGWAAQLGVSFSY
jgi:TonB-dependent receptor